MRPLRLLAYVHGLDCKSSVCSECQHLRINRDGTAWCSSSEKPEHRILPSGQCNASAVPYSSDINLTPGGDVPSSEVLEHDLPGMWEHSDFLGH